jgi:hypothetical protein
VRSFFLNLTLGAVVAGLVLIGDLIAHRPHPWSLVWIYALPFALVSPLYHAACSAAYDLGRLIRSSVDLHRLELYEKLGFRAPETFSLERGETGPALSSWLLVGERRAVVDDALARRPPDDRPPQQGEAA